MFDNTNAWVYTDSGAVLSSNTNVNNPRMWYYSATGSLQSDWTIPPGELNPKEINLAALYTRTQSIPDLPYLAIFKLFKFRTPSRRLLPGVSSVGVAWAVPESEIKSVVELITQYQPVAVWYSPAEIRVPVEQFPGVVVNGKLNHAELFKCFDAGIKNTAIASALGLDRNAIAYVHRKWKNKLPSSYQHKSTRVLDQAGIVIDLQAGVLSTLEIGTKYGCTTVTVRKLARKNGIA
jgi:hypothetical protein